MPHERNAFRLGLAMILFISLFIAVLVFLAPRGGGDMRLQVRFPHTQMTTVLQKGGYVVCGGKTVGVIRDYTLREMTDEASGYPALYAVATVEVESALGLRKDCRIVPEGPLLGGGGSLVVLDRGLGEPVAEGQMIDGQPAGDIASLTRALTAQLDPRDPDSLLAMIQTQLKPGEENSLVGKLLRSLEDVNSITAGLRNEFDATQKNVLFGKLHAILDHVNSATGLIRGELDASTDMALMRKLHRTLDTLNLGLGTMVAMLDENRAPIRETIANVKSTSEILEAKIATRIAEQLDPSNAAGLLAKVHVSLDRLGKSLQDVNAITTSGRELVVLNKDPLSRMIVNLKETSDHLKAASKEIRRSPWRLFYQPTIEEAAQANIFDAARSFTDAATRLDDAILRLQTLSEANGGKIDPNDPQFNATLEQLRQSYQNFGKIESALWQQLNVR